jgi:hypothetical protein
MGEKEDTFSRRYQLEKETDTTVKKRYFNIQFTSK